MSVEISTPTITDPKIAKQLAMEMAMDGADYEQIVATLEHAGGAKLIPDIELHRVMVEANICRNLKRTNFNERIMRPLGMFAVVVGTIAFFWGIDYSVIAVVCGLRLCFASKNEE